ncbi:MAG: VWA domain-containing protein [Planctomycetota bacterium]
MATKVATPGTLADQWRAHWGEALAAWSPYTVLREPIYFESHRAAAKSGMANEIAAIRLIDQVVMVNLETVRDDNLLDFALPIQAHEIGHHVLVPGNLADNARMLAAIRRELYGLPGDVAAMVANLYGDLHINDRLNRNGLDIQGVYRRLRELEKAKPSESKPSAVWRVYTRAYEYLWRLPKESLSPPGVSPDMDADAAVVASLVRFFAGSWLRGARRFATLLYPWLLEDKQNGRGSEFVKRGLHDTRSSGTGADGRDAVPDGLAEIGEEELDEGAEFDVEISGAESATGRRKHQTPAQPNTAPEKEGKGSPGIQFREPWEYADLLKTLGVELSPHEVTSRYYRERSLPHLIPFPQKKQPRATEPMAEGYEGWEATDELGALDLFGTISRSPQVIPGITTVQRTYSDIPGAEPARKPLDLDIYVDSSGSMPNPASSISYLALAGTILALSALRTGARVQATLWSGAGQFTWTKGFVRDEKAILGVITGCLNGGTAFPLNVLHRTYKVRKPDETPVHIVVISDDGVDTMLQPYAPGLSGEAVSRLALEKARGGGTLVLNIAPGNVGRLAALSKMGWKIHAVREWPQLVEFARRFVRENYEG